MNTNTPKTREITCVECGVAFLSFQRLHKVCSPECKKIRMKRLSGRMGSGLSSGTVGSITELVISADLMRRGYAVFRALSPACFCDLIAFKDGFFLRIECRTGYRNYVNESLSFPKKKNGEIDIFAIYIVATKEIIYLADDAKTPYEV